MQWWAVRMKPSVVSMSPEQKSVPSSENQTMLSMMLCSDSPAATSPGEKTSWSAGRLGV